MVPEAAPSGKTSPEDMAVLRTLLAKVCRAFYEPKFVICLDLLSKVEFMKDEHLAAKMKIQMKEIHKICGRLKAEGIVTSVTRLEPRASDQRPVNRQFYYIDYKRFVDIVKWKTNELRLDVKRRMDKELENKGYVCPRCQKLYSPLEVLSLCDPRSGLFHCEIDNMELESNENAQGVKESEELHARLMEQTRPIIALLKRTDNITYTVPDIKAEAELASGDGGDLKFATDTGDSIGEIVIEFEKDSAASRKAAEAAAEKKRQQNALPIWHLHSTVSGEHGTKSLEYTSSAPPK